MTPSQKAITVLALVGAVFAGRADESARDSSPAGALGKNYLETGFSVQDIDHKSNHAYDFTAGVNCPVTGWFDLSGYYDYDWFSARRNSEHSNVLSFAETFYTTFAGVKPFASAKFGYVFLSSPEGPDDYGTWGFEAGVEIPVGPLALTPFISYSDDFQASADSTQAYDFGVEGNYWFEKNWGVFGSFAYENVLRVSPGEDSRSWRLGLRYRF